MYEKKLQRECILLSGQLIGLRPKFTLRWAVLGSCKHLGPPPPLLFSFLSWSLVLAFRYEKMSPIFLKEIQFVIFFQSNLQYLGSCMSSCSFTLHFTVLLLLLLLLLFFLKQKDTADRLDSALIGLCHQFYPASSGMSKRQSYSSKDQWPQRELAHGTIRCLSKSQFSPSDLSRSKHGLFLGSSQVPLHLWVRTNGIMQYLLHMYKMIVHFYQG